MTKIVNSDSDRKKINLMFDFGVSANNNNDGI